MTTKIKVSKTIIQKLLGKLSELYDDEVTELMQRDDQDEGELRKIIQEFIVPRFEEYDDASQQTIKNSLLYFLGTHSFEINRMLPYCRVPIDPPSERDFFLMIWDALFHTPFPSEVHKEDYEEDDGVAFEHSLTKRPDLDN